MYAPKGPEKAIDYMTAIDRIRKAIAGRDPETAFKIAERAGVFNPERAMLGVRASKQPRLQGLSQAMGCVS